MKLAARQVDGFIRAPSPDIRVILLYGPDTGLVNERARTVGRTVVADLNDPFNAIRLNGRTLGDDPARLNDEAMAFSMLGGNRLIMVEGADDALTPALKDYLANPSPTNLVVLEAGNLAKKSTLRALCEKSTTAAALACYVDEGRDLSILIREAMKAEGHAVDPDALGWLARNIAGDRQRIRSETAKIATYMADRPGQSVALADALACCAESGVETLDDLIGSAALGRPGDAMAAYAKLLAEGVSIVTILRSLQTHFRKLHLACVRVENGMSVEASAGKVAPPLFFKTLDSFTAQMRQWSAGQVETVLQRLTILESQTRQTGMPVDTLCAQAVLALSRTRR